MPACLSASHHVHNGLRHVILALCSPDSEVILPMSFCMLQKCMNFTSKETEAMQILRLETHVDEVDKVEEVAESHGHVESEIAKWQKEIDQTEQQWLKKLQRSGSVESAVAGMLQQNESLEPATMEKLQHGGSAEPASTRKLQHGGSAEPASTRKLQHGGSAEPASTRKLEHGGSAEPASTRKLEHGGSAEPASTRKLQHGGSAEPASTRKLQHGGSLHSATTDKPPSARQRTRQFVSDVHNGGSWEQNKPLKNNVQTAKSKIVEMGEWRNSGCMTPSECSTVSSDLDFDTDVPVVLPSVKELAKQFSGSTTSDSDSSVTKPLPEPRRGKVVEMTKDVVIMAREKQQQEQQQSMREVHSLTARSISKEFRDGLRRNLPSQLDRNLHTTANSTLSNGVRNLALVSTDSLVAVKNGDIKVPLANGSEELEGVKSVSALQDRGLIGPKDSRLKDVTEGYQHDSYVRADGSIPGYTSDESGTQSPSPPLRRRLKLQNSIQFWEQLQHSGK